MKILGIETSCDETAVALIEIDQQNKNTKTLSSVVSSSLYLHSQTGGIIPEVAAREQIKYMIPALKKVLASPEEINAIAVTYGPGLIGSLVVGIETAKTLAYVWKKPIIPVNHLVGHIYANWIEKDRIKNIKFPAIILIVSGGHTDLLLMKNHGDLKLIGGTRDDAAGEAFDKIGRLLDISYPAGPKIEKLALKGEEKAFRFPRPMIDSNDFDFSFSGLKTAVLREVRKIKKLDDKTKADICTEAQKAITDVLTYKTIEAAKKYQVKSILLSGGVAANDKLRNEFLQKIKHEIPSVLFFVPAKNLCTDNAIMIATAAFFNYKPMGWEKITGNPELYFD